MFSWMKSCRSSTKMKSLRKEKRYSIHKFIREFPDKNWNHRGLDHLMKKNDESDSTAWKSGSGRRRTARRHRRCRWSGTESGGQTAGSPQCSTGGVVWVHVFAWMVDILIINFEPATFWCILFILSILVSVHLIDINMCKVLILREMCYFVYENFTRYGNNKTKVWQEMDNVRCSS